MKTMSLILVGLLAFALPAIAAPATMDYQGYFEDNGNPMGGTHTLAFALYTQLAGGEPLWNETQESVPFDRGLFSVKLGTVNPLSLVLFQHPEVYLEVQIDGTGFGTRTRLSSVPYAFLSALADEATHAVHADSALYAETAGSGGGESHWAANGNDIHNTNSGNVSVGTSASEAPLTVYGSPTAPPNMMVLRNTATGGGPMAFGIGAEGSVIPSGIYGIGDENDMRLAINRITGNVGIGTTTPSEKLDVENGSVRITGSNSTGDTAKLYFLNTVYGLNHGWGWQALDSGSFELEEFGVSNGRLTFAPGGNMGVNTYTPQYQLDVNGMINSSSGGYRFPDGSIQTSAAGSSFWGGNGNNIYNTNAGNVGVGTSTPGFPLEVAGRGRIATSSTSWAMNVSNGETSGSPIGIYATTEAQGTEAAVKGAAWTGSGNTTGVLGVIDSPGIQNVGGNPVAVYGWATYDGPGDAFGVLGRCKTHLSSPGGGWDAPAGVFGWSTTETGYCWGVWGENASHTSGTSAVRGLAVATSGVVYGVEGETKSSAGLGIHAIGGMGVAGVIATEVDSDRGKSFMYAVSSTQNWFEDFGSGMLVNGEARILLRADFLMTVDIASIDDLHVFPVATSENIDGRLIVLKETNGFTIREQGPVKHNGTFDFRVVAPRKGYRGVRLASVDDPRPDLQFAQPGLFNNGHRSDPQADARMTARQ